MDRTQRIEAVPRRPVDPGPTARDGEQLIDVSVSPTQAPPHHRTAAAAANLLGQEGPGPLAIAWRDRWLLLAVALVVGIAAYALSTRLPTVYAASTTMAFPYTGSEIALPGGDAERSRSLRTEAERITSIALLQQASETLGTAIDPREIRDRVEAIPASDADVITVRAVGSTPTEAADTADAVAVAYRRQVEQRQRRSIKDLRQQRSTLERRVTNQQKQVAAQLLAASGRTGDDTAEVSSDPAVAASRLALEASVTQLSEVQVRLDQAKAQQESSIGRIQVLQPADVPETPEQPRPGRNAATLVVLALMGVGTVRWWRAEPDLPQVDSAATVEAVLGAAVIAEIPYLRRSSTSAGVVVDDYPQIIDAYRMVAAMSPVHGSVLVSAAQPDEACSDLVLNVAAVLDRDGYRVVLVEGDPQVGRLRDRRHDGVVGLTDFMAGEAHLPDVLHMDAGTYPHLAFIPWGRRPAGLPRGQRSGLTYAIDELRTITDLVLIDGPPLASSADALHFAANVDAILLVVSVGTPLADLSRLRARLRQLDRPVLGAVLQHRRPPGRRRGRTTTTPVRWHTPSSHEADGEA